MLSTHSKFMVTEVSPVSTTVYLPPVTTRCLRRAYKVGILPREQESGGEKHMPGSGFGMCFGGGSANKVLHQLP